MSIKKTILKLNLYLKQLRLNQKQHTKLDILSWQKENCNLFSQFYLMAHALLSITITVFTSESAFCIGGKILIRFNPVLIQPLKDRVWVIGCATHLGRPVFLTRIRMDQTRTQLTRPVCQVYLVVQSLGLICFHVFRFDFLIKYLFSHSLII